MLDDTIIAVATPLAPGGLGLVRLSGDRALTLSQKFFRAKTRRSRIPARHPVLGHLFDPQTEEAFEEALLTYFPGPHSYTTEDVVEISTHGSPVLLEEVIRLGIEAGARHAHPGEFTLRALLGGRIDLLQAEAVNDIIMSSSLEQAKISFRQMEGRLSRRIRNLRKGIIQILSQIEAGIEFPDEGVRISSVDIARSIQKWAAEVDQLVQSYDLGKTLREGLTLVIVGRANVGKSTLFNALLERDRAIVTPFPGTTRDYLREPLRIKDSLFTLVDMAGLDNSSDPIEQEGLLRGSRLAAQADGILLVLDASRPESETDLELAKKYRNKKTILVWNKTDLPQKMGAGWLGELGTDLPRLEISALERHNLSGLKAKIHQVFVPERKRTEDVILHLRQKLLLEEIGKSLGSSLQVLMQGFSEEVLAEEIRSIPPLIGQLVGDIRTDDILDQIFGRFCIGK
jgi:tRNA modification GTPase